MCGRFTFTGNIKWLIDHFLLPAMPTFANRFNIAPLQPILAIVFDHDKNKTAWDFFSWGLVPTWAEDCSQASKMINARAETLAEKPSFKNPFKYRRCIIPASGFYEWVKGRGMPQPYYFSPGNEEHFLFAGIWEFWHGKGGEEIRTCSIITRPAVDPVLEVHHRMPVLLAKKDAMLWLKNPFERTVHQKILTKNYSGHILSTAVSKFVNNVRNDSEECIVPVKIFKPEQPDLI